LFSAPAGRIFGAVPASRSRTTLHGRYVALAAAALIGFATLTPRPDQAHLIALTPPWCLVCGQLGAVDVLLNVALFVPFGAGLRMAGWSLLRTGAAAFVVSAAVEVAQSIIPGRDPSLSDVVTNSIGGVLGAALAGWSPHLATPTPRTARWLAAAWATVWLAQTALAAALIQPALPRSWYWGQLAPDLPQFEQFTGEVRVATAGPRQIRIGRLGRSADIRNALLAGEELRATTTPGRTTAGLAPIVSLFDEQQREIVLLGRWGDDLVYRLRTRTFDFRLRPPGMRLANAFRAADTLVEVTGRYDPSAGTFAASLQGAQARVERVVPLDAQWAWSLLLPFPYAHGIESAGLTALWVFGWMLLLGYWAMAYRPVALVGAMLVLAVGLGALPRLWDLAPATMIDWLAGLGGLAGGAMAAAQWHGAPSGDGRGVPAGT
jgi:hypothetical protein